MKFEAFYCPCCEARAVLGTDVVPPLEGTGHSKLPAVRVWECSNCVYVTTEAHGQGLEPCDRLEE